MSRKNKEGERIYRVVISQDDQYSIWPADRENMLGWTDVGKTGTKAECIEYINAVWVGERPADLSEQLEAAARQHEQDTTGTE